ncbi:MAG: ribulose-phosphate 3-epimerase [Bacteroidota bacterium]
MSSTLISPSILAADFANLQSDVELMNSSEADYLHIDIMDGVFVPNISFGFPVIDAIHKHSQKPLDFHLMIDKPEQYLTQCKKAGAEIISVHYEGCTHLHRVVQEIKSLDCKAGVVLNPHTPVNVLVEIIKDIDLVLLMSVNPGFGGQKFIEHTLNKTAAARALIDNFNPDVLLEIDGGVNIENAPALVEGGANMLVAGSSVFGSDDPIATISQLRAL